jgi:hypothetical protein
MAPHWKWPALHEYLLPVLVEGVSWVAMAGWAAMRLNGDYRLILITLSIIKAMSVGWIWDRHWLSLFVVRRIPAYTEACASTPVSFLEGKESVTTWPEYPDSLPIPAFGRPRISGDGIRWQQPAATTAAEWGDYGNVWRGMYRLGVPIPTIRRKALVVPRHYGALVTQPWVRAELILEVLHDRGGRNRCNYTGGDTAVFLDTMTASVTFGPTWRCMGGRALHSRRFGCSFLGMIYIFIFYDCHLLFECLGVV